MTMCSTALVLISGNRLLILNERVEVKLVKLTLRGRLVIILSRLVSLFGAVPGSGRLPTPLTAPVGRRLDVLAIDVLAMGVPASDVDGDRVLVRRAGREVRLAKTVHSWLITVLNLISR